MLREFLWQDIYVPTTLSSQLVSLEVAIFTWMMKFPFDHPVLYPLLDHLIKLNKKTPKKPKKEETSFWAEKTLLSENGKSNTQAN